MEEEIKDIKEKVIQIRRVTKVVKGGKKMGFRVCAVVGDEKGSVGIGIGKASEVASAIRKAVEAAKKAQVTVPFNGTTVPHEVLGRKVSCHVLLRPAPPGTGVIAGGPVRAVLELAGFKDVVSKSLGSNNAINLTKATVDGLSQLRSREEVEQIRGKKLTVKVWSEAEDV